MATPLLGEILACLSGSVLAEVLKPAPTWRGTGANLGLGIAAGWWGPLGVEAYFELLKQAHQLVTFLCAFSGSALLRWYSDSLAKRKFLDWWEGIKAARDVLRSPTPPGVRGYERLPFLVRCRR
jgi:hypothetical protein